MIKNNDPWDIQMISHNSALPDINETSGIYEMMLISVLKCILDRYEKSPDYHFIDTKLSLITGQDFAADDPIRGRNIIYSYIQGRGLEAMVGHACWLENCPNIGSTLRDQLIGRIRKLITEVLRKMETLRNRNNGRLFFMMTPDGTPVHRSVSGLIEPCCIPDGSNYSDLFYVKGMAAAAHLLNLTEIFDEACSWFIKIYKDIKNDRFISDQQQLDPKNIAAKPVQGRYSHAPRMIGIGAASVFLKCTKNVDFAKIGMDFLDHILQYHVHIEMSNPVAHRFDMWEFVNSQGNPYIDENNVLFSDPGHACEFVGLALGLIHSHEQLFSLDDAQIRANQACKKILTRVLKRNFANGFSRRGFGICKGFDLISGHAINSDMPWWSLPETMRAALSACAAVPKHQCPSYRDIAATCSNAFLKYYVRPSINYMAVQTLNEDGQCIDSIPATPDADPGYHTGLSIIDCLNLFYNGVLKT